MKLILLSVFSLFVSKSAFAQSMGCLGFPAGAKFNCTLDNGTILKVDIPDGHGCNQPPVQGLIDDVHVVYSPTTGWDKNGKTYVNFFFDAEKTEEMRIECATAEDIVE